MAYSKSLYYEILMSLLAIITVAITLLEITGNISSDSYLLNIDTGILQIIF